MSFSQAIQSIFSQYTNFHGRARRSEYWYFVLLSILGNAVISAVVSVLHFGYGTQGTLMTLWQLVLLLPGLAVTVRRLHDIGKSGWCILFVLIPLVGEILLIVWLLRDSQLGANDYGTSEKYPHGVPFRHSESHDYSAYTNHSPTSKASYYQPQADRAGHATTGLDRDRLSRVLDKTIDNSFAGGDFVNKNYDEDDLGITCPHCGMKNVARSRFCTSCGAWFE